MTTSQMYLFAKENQDSSNRINWDYVISIWRDLDNQNEPDDFIRTCFCLVAFTMRFNPDKFVEFQNLSNLNDATEKFEKIILEHYDFNQRKLRICSRPDWLIAFGLNTESFEKIAFSFEFDKKFKIFVQSMNQEKGGLGRAETLEAVCLQLFGAMDFTFEIPKVNNRTLSQAAQAYTKEELSKKESTIRESTLEYIGADNELQNPISGRNFWPRF